MVRLLPFPVRASLAAILSGLIGLILLAPATARPDPGDSAPGAAADALPATHLVISEVMTGGTSASDEFVELYNPASDTIAIGGLELVYASASGATVTHKASWDAGSSPIPAGGHVLVANAAGTYASMADVTYANGLAATGGSVALRTLDTQAVVDAVGWGTASALLEGGPVTAPPAGSSLERLPGGTVGSTQDTDDNAVDFVLRDVPDPQNAAADPVPSQGPSASATPTATALPSETPSPSAMASPSGTPSPTPTPLATPSVTPTSSPSPTPTPASTPIPIAEARALPDGTSARIAGTALMGSDFADGGGCVDDGSGGIAVLPTGSAFPRGSTVDALGIVDDRYAQRTVRVDATALLVSAGGEEPQPRAVRTGDIGEADECRLVRISGTVDGSATLLSTGLAFDLDDGSGSVRVLVATASGIDTLAWEPNATLDLVGVVGQRDSSGTGGAGYRVQPRDPADVVSILPPPTPSPSASPSATPTPSEPSSPGLLTIADARAAASGATVRVRGVVTLENGLVDAPTAVIQDATGAIVLRLGDAAGALHRGTLVEVIGRRSTKAGMETIHTDLAPVVLATRPEPEPVSGTSGGLGEAREAQLVRVRGEVASAVTRSTAGNTAFTLDDGSGPLRVTLFAAAGFAVETVERGDVIEVTAILAQETTGALPERGYRLWPRAPSDIRIVTPAADGGTTGGASGAAVSPSASTRGVSSVRPATARPPSAADLVAPRIDPPAGSSAGVGDPGGSTPVQGRGSNVLLTSGTALPARGPLAMGATTFLVGLLLAIAWRAGTLERLRSVVLARITELGGIGDDGDRPPG